jgi:predicted nucleic acid-binding protein
LPVKPPIVKARIRKIEECVADLQGIRKLPARAFIAADRRGLSLVDLSSFETMRRLGIRSVFTFDRHFRQYGFEILP